MTVYAIVARVFRIWGDLEIAHGHFQDPETAQPSRDGWAVSGFWAISRWAKGIFRILKRPSPFQDLEIATFLRLPKGIFTIEALANDCLQLHDVYYDSHFRVTWLVGNEVSCD